MTKKVRLVPYALDSKDVKSLPLNEIKAILRGADPLVMSGGRSMLVKILKGSRVKKLLALEFDKECPVYGFYRHLTLSDIQARVDWTILNGYIAIKYDYRLPMLRYTPKGWEIERETYANELLSEFNKMIAKGPSEYDMLYLKDRDRGLIMRLLELVEESGNPKYIPLLSAWSDIDYMKVRERIGFVIDNLEKA